MNSLKNNGISAVASQSFCIVLAAGFSSRMGAFKPLLPVGDVPAIVRTVSSAQNAGATVVVVTGHRGDEVRTALERTGAVIAHNAQYASGMFSSVLTGVRAVLALAADVSEPCGVFLLPADCCAIRTETFAALLREFERTGERVQPAYTPASDAASHVDAKHKSHPPIIPLAVMRGLLTHDPDDDGAKGYLRRFPSHSLEVGDEGVTLDMDTPRDYAQLLRHLGLPTFPDISRTRVLLSKYETAPDIVAHGEHVAEFCVRAGERLNALGAGINVPLLEASALLHDICRAEDEHGQRGFELLLREGYPDAAMLIRGHMEPPESGATREEELLYVFDKLLRRGELVPPSLTLQKLRERFAGDADALNAATARMEACEMLLNKYKNEYNINLMNV